LGGPQPETPMSNVYSARVKTRRFLKWRFTVSLRGKAALQERPRISRAEYNQTRIDLQSLWSEHGKTVDPWRPYRTHFARLWYNVRYRCTFV